MSLFDALASTTVAQLPASCYSEFMCILLQHMYHIFPDSRPEQSAQPHSHVHCAVAVSHQRGQPHILAALATHTSLHQAASVTSCNSIGAYPPWRWLSSPLLHLESCSRRGCAAAHAQVRHACNNDSKPTPPALRSCSPHLVAPLAAQPLQAHSACGPASPHSAKPAHLAAASASHGQPSHRSNATAGRACHACMLSPRRRK